MHKKASAPNSAPFSRKLLCLLFFTVWSTLLIFCSGQIESEDGWLYLSVSKNIYYSHRIESAPNEFQEGKNVHFNSNKDAQGRWHATGALGYSIAMVPAVALSDLTHRALQTSPSNHFPLEHDWTLHFYASMTNAFFGALLVVILTLYIYELTHQRKQAITFALLSLFSTILLPLSKQAFAHVLFTDFVLLSFYFVRKFALTRKGRYLIGSFLSYGAVFFAYNETYFIPVIPLLVYYLLLIPQSQRKKTVLLLAILSTPIVLWKASLFLSFQSFLRLYPKVLLDGVWGLLFSPGKSVFLYSPPLIALLVFWHKIEKKYIPEVVSFTLLTGLYLYIIGNAWIFFATGQKEPIWHGGMDWGPRYISTLVPFGMLLLATIIPKLSLALRRFVVVPLFLAGLCLQVFAVSIPYIMQYPNLPNRAMIGEEEFTVYDFAAFIPHYSPLYSLPRTFFSHVSTLKRTLDHGPYNVRMYDGFEVPLMTGAGAYRGFREQGHMFFTKPKDEAISKIFLRFFNIADQTTASTSAIIKASLNGKVLTSVTLENNGHEVMNLYPAADDFKDGINRLDLTADFPATTSSTQVIYVTQMTINEKNVNLESLDYPEVSTGGKDVSPIPYQYFGQKVTDHWELWQLRARITERTFDFWWIKNLYYWDRPHAFLWFLFGMDVVSICICWFFLWKNVTNLERDK